MAQIVRLKRSSTPGSKPTTSNLETGELAINVYDGKVFLRKSGSADTIEELVSNNYSGSVNITGAVTASYFVGDGSRLENVSIAQTATIQRSFTDSSTWVVNHNFDTPNAIAQVYDFDGYQIIPETLRHTNNNTITITFEAARSGYVVVAKGGHIVSGSVSAANIEGFEDRVQTKLDAQGVFSGSAQVIMGGDVSGTADAVVISTLDGGSI
jgi:hypothetical protein